MTATVDMVNIQWTKEKQNKFECISDYLLQRSKSYWLVMQVICVRLIVLAVAAGASVYLYDLYVKDQYSNDERDLT